MDVVRIILIENYSYICITSSTDGSGSDGQDFLIIPYPCTGTQEIKRPNPATSDPEPSEIYCSMNFRISVDDYLCCGECGSHHTMSAH